MPSRYYGSLIALELPYLGNVQSADYRLLHLVPMICHTKPRKDGMMKPDFHEGQLQQCLNNAFVSWGLEYSGSPVHPVVPSLHEEADLGWDTGFYLPWLSSVRLSAHLGCNFFIQYKLSEYIKSPAGKERQDWGSPYYRFRLYHGEKSNPDRHQLIALKDLTEINTNVYYATNQVARRNDLFTVVESGKLLDKTPFLAVCDIMEDHDVATFTPDSDYFWLHSEARRCQKYSIRDMRSHILQSQFRPLAADNELVFEAIRPLIEQMRGTDTFIAAYLQLHQSVRSNDQLFVHTMQWLMLRYGLRLFLNIDMMRFPKPA
jgi:hypothetical protein